jgi:hypothetical protein
MVLFVLPGKFMDASFDNGVSHMHKNAWHSDPLIEGSCHGIRGECFAVPAHPQPSLRVVFDEIVKPCWQRQCPRD